MEGTFFILIINERELLYSSLVGMRIKGRPERSERPLSGELLAWNSQNSTVNCEKSEELVKLLDLVTYCLSLICPVLEM